MAKTTGKGEGSIVDKPHKDGRYQGSLIDPKSGKRVYVYGPTKDDVRLQLTQLHVKIVQGQPLSAEHALPRPAPRSSWCRACIREW